jgi:hypothetical protein
VGQANKKSMHLGQAHPPHTRANDYSPFQNYIWFVRFAYSNGFFIFPFNFIIFNQLLIQQNKLNYASIGKGTKIDKIKKNISLFFFWTD